LKLAVLGVGLIGGSIGLAARRRMDAYVSGYDPDRRACAAALERGAIDEQAPDIATAVAGSEVVFAAAPVGVLAETVREVLTLVGPDCVVSDVGSTKLVLHDAREDPRFVGGHPLAGAETAGVENAREDLFEGATWYLTPAPSTNRALYERLERVIELLGARPAEIAADAHDRLMASVSHLPHVLANVLVAQAAEVFEREGCTPAVGPSLRDTIRVAGANTAIWTDIYLANSAALIEAIEQAMGGLEDVRAALTAADVGALVAWNERARAARTQLLSLSGDTPSADAGLPPADAGPPPSGAGP
jgi:prephenate dehydrogenase